MTLQPSTHLGPYEILAPLGAGGMGEAYRAEETKLAQGTSMINHSQRKRAMIHQAWNPRDDA